MARTEHSRTPNLCPPVAERRKRRNVATRPAPYKSTPSVAAGLPPRAHDFRSERGALLGFVLSFLFEKTKISVCAPGGDDGGAGAPAGGSRGVVGARERLAGVAGRDLLRPRRPLRHRRRRLMRKRLVSSFC